MAGNLSNHAEALLLKWLNTDETVTRPAAWFLGLYSAAPTDAGGGTEISAAGYARQAIDFGTDGATNTNEILFEADGANWPEATHVGVFDAASAGNLIWHGPMTAPKQIDDGDAIAFDPGDIDTSLD